METTNKTVLVTGASSGIGKALTANFAKDGYDIVMAARSVDKMETLAAELRKQYRITVTVIRADLESDDGAVLLHSAVKSRNITLSALANNAGYGLFGEFKKTDLRTELAIMRINMESLVILTKLFLPDLLSTKGKIINLASTAAFQPVPTMAVYAATKAFVLSFSEALASELEGTGVAVTAFCPGPTASGFAEKAKMTASAQFKPKKLPTAIKVAAAGYRAMQRGQRVYIPGVKNVILAQGSRFAPRTFVTRAVKSMMRPVD
jgi:uncharacterized protein